MTFLVPPYDSGTLAAVVPSLLAGLGVPGTHNTLALPARPRICLLLVDGLGWRSLQAHRADAPFLSSLLPGREPIATGFPATTAAGLAALGTGLPPGEHGVVGYSFAAGKDELLNALGWHRQGKGRPVDLRERVVPEEFQPRPTTFERAAGAGVAVTLVGSRDLEGSGLTRAVLRGGRFRAAHSLGDLTNHVLDALTADERVLCYTYHPDLDALGHVYGPGSRPWRHQLAYLDHLAARIAAGLPADGLLVVTADHGMVTVAEQDRVDFDTEPALQAGVHLLGGEPRARHVYTDDGAAGDVRQAWQELLGERAVVVAREEAIAAGWFGPGVAAHVRPRIGDLVVAARETTAVIRSQAERRLSRFTGQHGSLTADEQLVPLLAATSAG